MSFHEDVRQRFEKWCEQRDATPQERGRWLTTEILDRGDGIERSVGIAAVGGGTVHVYELATGGLGSYSVLHEQQRADVLETVLDRAAADLDRVTATDLRYARRTSRG
jgi:hypothetical protein